MADWDADSKQLTANLQRTLRSAQQHAHNRQPPTTNLVRSWHAEILTGLQVPDPAYVGVFRGEGLLEHINIHVGHCWGTPPNSVAKAVQQFLHDLADTLQTIDAAIPAGGNPESDDALEAVLTAAALAHAKWVEIHPFANGNGRTARLWANWVLMRYGISPLIRLRPRPEGQPYAIAARRALCEGDYEPTITLFFHMFDEFTTEHSGGHE